MNSFMSRLSTNVPCTGHGRCPSSIHQTLDSTNGCHGWGNEHFDWCAPFNFEAKNDSGIQVPLPPTPAASPCVRTLRLNRLEWEGHPSWAAPSYIISTFACSSRVHETLPLTGQCSTRAVHPTFDILSLGVSSSRTPFKDVSGRRRYSTFVLFLDRFQSRWFVHFRREGLFLVLFAAQKLGEQMFKDFVRV